MNKEDIVYIYMYTYIYKTGKDKYHMILLISGTYKNDTNEFIYKTEIGSQTQKMNL